MPYDLLLSDADGTLFDFAAGEKNAIAETFAAFHVPATEENVSLYHQVNAAQWKLLEKGETTQQKLRTDRFRIFLAESGYAADPVEMGGYFVKQLGQQRILLDGALAFCETVSSHIPVWLITNGISAVQRSRFASCAIKPYISGMVISEEIGHSKPHPAMIHQAMADAGITDKRRAVVLGDSITADIGAANNAGVDSILFTGGKPIPENHGATFAVKTLEEARRIILGC